jgi:hypothetical protein
LLVLFQFLPFLSNSKSFFHFLRFFRDA